MERKEGEEEEEEKRRKQHTPPNNRNAQERAQAAEHQRHDAPRRETLRQAARRFRRALQVQEIDRVARRVADGGDMLRVAGVEVFGGDGEGGLEEGGGFDHGGDEAGGDVPFDVAVEEPDAWR